MREAGVGLGFVFQHLLLDWESSGFTFWLSLAEGPPPGQQFGCYLLPATPPLPSPTGSECRTGPSPHIWY